MLVVKVLVVESLSVDANAPSAVTLNHISSESHTFTINNNFFVNYFNKIASLNHEVFDHTMKGRILESNRNICFPKNQLDKNNLYGISAFSYRNSPVQSCLNELKAR